MTENMAARGEGLKGLVEWLREQSEELMKSAIARESTAETMRGATPQELREAKALAEKMAGRKLPNVSTGSEEAKIEADVQCRIAAKLSDRARQISAWADELAALAAAPPSTAQQCDRPTHMYVWTVSPRWVAVAQANTVAEAREALLEEIGTSRDGSCPEREAADKWVREKNPSIWHARNAEFALTDSAELREQEAYVETLQKKLAALATPSPQAPRTVLQQHQDKAISILRPYVCGSEFGECVALVAQAIADASPAATQEQPAPPDNQEGAGWHDTDRHKWPTVRNRAEAEAQRSPRKVGEDGGCLCFDMGCDLRGYCLNPQCEEWKQASAIARRFHEAYERLAPDFGYETRKDSAVHWDHLPEKNRKLMLAACATLLRNSGVLRPSSVPVGEQKG